MSCQDVIMSHDRVVSCRVVSCRVSYRVYCACACSECMLHAVHVSPWCKEFHQCRLITTDFLIEIGGCEDHHIGGTNNNNNNTQHVHCVHVMCASCTCHRHLICMSCTCQLSTPSSMHSPYSSDCHECEESKETHDGWCVMKCVSCLDTSSATCRFPSILYRLVSSCESQHQQHVQRAAPLVSSHPTCSDAMRWCGGMAWPGM